MDDYKVIIYIVLGALYYGYKFLSKRKEQGEQVPKKTKPIAVPQQQRNSQAAPAKENKRPKSIEDLLQEAKRELETKQKPVHRPFYETQETINYETIDYDTNPEKAIVENVNPYKEYRTIDVDSKIDNTSRFAEFASRTKEKHPILKSFTNKTKAREAFILSEIFKSKF